MCIELLLKFGVNLFLWTSVFTKDSINLIEHVRRLGFDGVEIPIDRLDLIDAEATRKTIEAMELGCTTCSVLGPTRDLISEDNSIRENAKNYIKECIRLAGLWGADVFCGPLYSAVGKFTGEPRTQVEWQLAVEGLGELAEFAKGYGVTLAIEPLNRFETYFINTAEDAIKLIQEINQPNIKLHLDTFHMNIEEKNFYKAVKRAAELLFHMHCSDSDRGTPGGGNVNYDEIFKALKEINYNRWLVIESFVPGIKEVARAASIWRSLAPSSDYLAEAGLRFLKGKARAYELI